MFLLRLAYFCTKTTARVWGKEYNGYCGYFESPNDRFFLLCVTLKDLRYLLAAV